MTESLLILYEDSHCLAVVKPAGLLTQGMPERESTLEEAVRRHLRPDDPASAYVGTVHRLDRPVSGVVVWAKTPKAARRLADAVRRPPGGQGILGGRRGGPRGLRAGLDAAGTWDDWLTPPDASGVVRAVAPRAAGSAAGGHSVPARSGRTAAAGHGLAPALARDGADAPAPRPGRGAGLPILGDSIYGSTRPFARGIALHARALTIEHPILRRAICLVAPLPDAWGEQGIILPETPVARP